MPGKLTTLAIRVQKLERDSHRQRRVGQIRLCLQHVFNNTFSG